MLKEIDLNGKTIQYNLTYKRVRNINLRIKTDGTVWVSANKRVLENEIENFLISKEKFILNALEKFRNLSYDKQIKYFDENEIRDVILELCEKVYPEYEKRGVRYPQIKFRKMVSRWGSCHPAKGLLTFNTNLLFAPKECIEYVVHHEYTHFLVANHSPKFYSELSKTCPDWKERREKLKGIVLQK
jgi:predicted metal-dependent hydrolase